MKSKGISVIDLYLWNVSRFFGISKSEILRRVEGVVSVINLTDIRKKKTKLLSGVMQRRLSIAMALITQPEILFLDEPTFPTFLRVKY